ncbi:deoxycytidine deaminase [Streptomyces sp. GbtcB6]|uniref:dCTP deaminase n=1 Tax=Streptomyces sp. GbtcB6 TaxID=2824751 RepID=UPI001C3018D9|nr:deoxycytidine deaminase [Streptomyces sp. GbtcB6]
MILTGQAITEAVHRGEITISPFDEAMVNPNSYNYRLGRTLKVPTVEVTDARLDTPCEEIEIPEGGYVLQPRTVYLSTTVEVIGSPLYVPSLIGRSSVGRLGLFLQISADLGQLGACHSWTLEIVAVQPLRVYAGMKIGQVSFWTHEGHRQPYQGYYGHISEAVPCHPHAALGNPTHALEMTA